MANKDERTPLLASNSVENVTSNVATVEARSESPPPPYVQPEAGPSVDDAATLPIGTDELPPPYTPSAQGGVPMINCKVCQAIISLEGQQHLFVVKCNICGEATPIRAAPPGKKYIRCPCNLLLVCRSGATKILCPKTTCKRVITLPSTPSVAATQNRYHCGYCSQIFVISSPGNYTRCPHCRKWSSLGENYARKKGHIYLLIGFLFLAAATGVTVGTYEMAASSGRGIYITWIGGFLIGVMFIIRAIFLYQTRVSLPLVAPVNA